VTLESTSATTFTVTNTGETGSLSIASATVSAGPFLKTADTCTGASLAASEDCEIDVVYNPIELGASAAILEVNTNAANGTEKIAGLTGAGVDGVTVTGNLDPGTFDFGGVEIGEPQTATFTLSRTGGTGALEILDAAVSGPPFLIVSDSCAGAFLTDDETCVVEVEYSPPIDGAFAGTLTVVTNATDGTKKIAGLNGTSSSQDASTTDSSGVLGFSAAEYEFGEDIGVATMVVLRSDGSTGAVSVDYTTSDGTASVASGDYVETSSPPDPPLSWEDGDSSPKMITVEIPEPAEPGKNRRFAVILSNATGGAVLGETSVAQVDIGVTENVGSLDAGIELSEGGDSGCSFAPRTSGSSPVDALIAMACFFGLVVFRIRRRTPR
jgi:hypothetical protein